MSGVRCELLTITQDQGQDCNLFTAPSYQLVVSREIYSFISAEQLGLRGRELELLVLLTIQCDLLFIREIILFFRFYKLIVSSLR